MYRSDAFRADLVLVLGLVSSLAEFYTLSFQNLLPFPPLQIAFIFTPVVEEQSHAAREALR